MVPATTIIPVVSGIYNILNGTISVAESANNSSGFLPSGVIGGVGTIFGGIGQATAGYGSLQAGIAQAAIKSASASIQQAQLQAANQWGTLQVHEFVSNQLQQFSNAMDTAISQGNIQAGLQAANMSEFVAQGATTVASAEAANTSLAAATTALETASAASRAAAVAGPVGWVIAGIGVLMGAAGMALQYSHH